MGEDADQILLHGACRITVGGVILGHTTPEGVQATVTGDPVHAFTGKYGANVPSKTFNPGQGIEVEFMLNESVMTALVEAFPNWTRVSGSGKEKINVGVIAGEVVPSASLVLTSFLSDNTPSRDLTISKAVPVGKPTISYVGNQEQRWAVKFTGQMNELTGVVFSYGDASASAETDNADVSSVVPAAEAVGISTATTVVWTFDRELDESTVVPANVLLFEDDATPVRIACSAPVLANNGASTTITLTPTSALAGAKLHLATVTQAIKDVNGLAIDGFASRFTTT